MLHPYWLAQTATQTVDTIIFYTSLTWQVCFDAIAYTAEVVDRRITTHWSALHSRGR